MDLIVKKRGHGKTYDLIKMSAETGYKILTPSCSKYIKDMANKLNLIIPEPLEYKHFNYYRDLVGFNTPVLIDDIDILIKQVLGCRVEVATLSPGNLVGDVLVEDVLSEDVLAEDIKNVIFNNPATIVYWKDGSKTVVKCQNGDIYSEELGLAMCIVKKRYRNKSNYNDVFKRWLPKKERDTYVAD